jgi:alpha-tubulin suppressor-like RCC1 family protein
MAFISCNNGNLKDVFITEYELIDRYVGDRLWNWGYGICGRLGNNSTTNRSSPVQTVSTGTNWKQVSAGRKTAAIKTDGSLWIWGENFYGGIGDNTTTNRSSPVQTVSTGTNWKQVSSRSDTAGFHTAAIKTDGSLWLWGYNANGQLGNNTTTNRSSPVQTISGGTNWKQVSSGGNHTAAIKTDGTLWLWGFSGSFGRLGNNSTIDQSSPVQTISGGNDWRSVSVGDCFSSAIKTDGTLWLWGNNVNGQLGNNSTINQSSPVQTVSTGNNWKQVSIGSSHTAAIKTDGTLWLWGINGRGELGNNSTIDQSSPVQTISGGTNWKQGEATFGLTAAIKTDGTLWIWGCGNCGGLGNNSTIDQSSPVQTISGGTNWKQVSAGYRGIAAVTFTDI